MDSKNCYTHVLYNIVSICTVCMCYVMSMHVCLAHHVYIIYIIYIYILLVSFRIYVLYTERLCLEDYIKLQETIVPIAVGGVLALLIFVA